jgi:hypothetical protein
MKHLAALLALSALTAVPSFAQPVPPIAIRFSEKPVRVDGKLDDPAWRDAAALPLARTDGTAVQGGAVARLAWDRENLYLSLEIPDEIIVAERSDRDAALWEKDDVVELFLWPREDQPYYYQVVVNPRNTLYDAFFISNASHSGADLSVPDWNPAIQSMVRLQPVLYRPDRVGPPAVGGSWTVEMALPVASLSNRAAGPPMEGDTWRAQIVRFNRPDPGPGQLDATSLAPYAPVTEPFRLDSFATLHFQGGPAPVIPPLVPKSPVQAAAQTPPTTVAAVPDTVQPALPPEAPSTPEAVPTTNATPAPVTPPTPVTPPPSVAAAAGTTPTTVKPVTLNFHDMRAGAALDLLFQGTGLTYALSPEARPVVVSATVSADLKNSPFDAALSALLNQINLTFQKQGAMYVLLPKPTGGA